MSIKHELMVQFFGGMINEINKDTERWEFLINWLQTGLIPQGQGIRFLWERLGRAPWPDDELRAIAVAAQFGISSALLFIQEKRDQHTIDKESLN